MTMKLFKFSKPYQVYRPGMVAAFESDTCHELVKLGRGDVVGDATKSEWKRLEAQKMNAPRDNKK